MPIGGDTEGLNDSFKSRLDQLATVCNITVGSGFRTVEEQAKLYADYQAGRGNLAAPPGKSNHNHGLAADIDGDKACAHRNAAAYGLHFPVQGEDWHVEPIDLDAQHPDETGMPPEAHVAGPPPNPLPSILAAVTNALGGGSEVSSTAALGAALGKKPEVIEAASTERPPNSVTGGETGEGGDADSWIREAMRITGVGEDWYAGLHRRMMQESGGQNIPQGIVDINTQKGTPAFGPMQVIEPTFRAHALPGYENWKDPLHNTIAAIRYIQGRYGHPDNLPKGGY